jgi:hypothetical protein
MEIMALRNINKLWAKIQLYWVIPLIPLCNESGFFWPIKKHPFPEKILGF